MGVLDKIKNALFEVEYVEVEEPPKKEKKVKPKEQKVKPKEENKPIAKKIVLPGKKEEKVEAIEEEELLDEDFEIRPKDDVIKEEAKESFKMLDDDDFKVDEDIHIEEPEIIEEPVKQEVEYKPAYQEPKVEREVEYRPEPAYSEPRESRPYGMDNSYKVPVHQYGTYERYEEKAYFKPSPIISPIYGILDKNYRKEDVKEKKEVTLSSYTRGKVSVDDIRNKAYGEKEKEEVVTDSKVEVDEEEDNLMVDLSDKAKPEVKEITMGDALEYFQDLGLEYNVDYVDASNDKKNPKPEEKKEEVKEEVKEDIKEEVEDTKEFEKVPTEETAEDNDNLFDLIDSMYQENN